MNFEEWYAKLGEWAEENTALNMSYAMQRHLARHLEAWEASRPTPRALDGATVAEFCECGISIESHTGVYCIFRPATKA